MEKNPISSLQEHAMQNKKSIPLYTVIKQTNGSHLNTFVIRVSCEDHVAEGEGSNKKEAKYNAALAMLNLLNIKSNESPRKNLNLKSDDTTANKDSFPCKSPSSTINYISKLQEYLANQVLPVYTNTKVEGESHRPKFTVVCEWKGIQEEAVGCSKKEAKNYAAQKMYNNLMSQKEVDEHNDESKIKNFITKPQLQALYDGKVFYDKPQEISRNKAIELLPKLSKIGLNKNLSNNVSENNSTIEYRSVFQHTISDSTREIVITKLEDTMKACNNYFNDFSQQIPLPMLKDAIAMLSIDMLKVCFQSQKKFKIIGFQLITTPVLCEVGYGKCEREAEVQAILNTANTLTLLLY